MQQHIPIHSRKKWPIFIVGTLLLWVYSCDTNRPTTHELLDATLWVQHSAEYQAIGLQTYFWAKGQLDRALADPSWTAALEQMGNYSELPPAIIIDVDETALDNSPNEARLIRNQTVFTYDTWDLWVEEARAEPVPGALEFCQYAARKGVTIFYVTNRRDHLREATSRNLEAMGFPVAEGLETVLTRGENSDKGYRRSAVAEKYRILLLVGDDARDFSSAFVNKGLPERNDLPAEFSSYWGQKWIILPNPLYGDWEKVLFGKAGYRLDRQARLEKKYQALRF